MTNAQIQLKGTGFGEVPPPRPRLLLTVDGMDKTGKTHFALTAPGPIALQSIDFGSEGVVQKHAGGKQILIAEYNRNMPPEIDRRDLEALKKWHRANVVDKFIRDYRAALKAGVRTIVWDTATEFWEVLRLSHFGKTEKVPAQFYAAVNGEWQELIRLANDSDTNLILLHQQRDEWESYVDNQGRDKNRTTGRKVRSGNEKIGFLIQAQLETTWTAPRKDKRGEITEPGHFQIEITRCRQQPEMVGMTWQDEGITFANVATMILPELPPEMWE